MSTVCPGKLKVRNFVLFMVAYTFLYIFPNVHPGVEAMMLPLLEIDRATPLIPWTFMIYTSAYVLFLIVILLHDDVDRFKAFCRTAFGVLVISGAFFLLMPTTYPRPVYPESDSLFITWLMKLVSTADSPRNCFPSMHVGLTGIGAWSLRHKGPRVFAFFVVWSLLIFISTMTTKQHYFVDILGGMGVMTFVAVIDWALFEKGVFQAVLKPAIQPKKG